VTPPIKARRTTLRGLVLALLTTWLAFALLAGLYALAKR